MAIRTNSSAPTKVPEPNSNARFVLGSRPAVLRSPALTRIKPDKASTRDYGKEQPLSGDTGMTGLS